MASQTFTISSNINAKFEQTGPRGARVAVTGFGSARVRFRLSWSDNPGVAGDAIDSITVDGRTFNSPGESGSDTRDWIMTPGNYGIDFNGLIEDLKSVSNTSIKMIDSDGDDTNAEFEIISVNDQDISFQVISNISVSPNPVYNTTCTNLVWGGSSTWGTPVVTLNGAAAATSGNEQRCPTLQSVAGSSSPATRTWTLRTCSGPGNTYCVEESATLSVYNDTTPSNSWQTSFINLNPNQEYTLSLGQLQGVDAPTYSTISEGSIGNGSSFGTGNYTFSNGSGVSIRVFSAPFNTTVPSSGTFGLTNDKTFNVTVGTQSFTVTLQTKAPRIAEDFNYSDKKDEYPYEDIDLISNSPTNYLVTANITADDIEIPVEIKASNPNIQVNVNGTGWKNLRQI